ATIHLLFRDEERGRAFGIYGFTLGFGGAGGFGLGGWVGGLYLDGVGWGGVFFFQGSVGRWVGVVGGGPCAGADGKTRDAARPDRRKHPSGCIAVRARSAAARRRLRLGAVAFCRDRGGAVVARGDVAAGALGRTRPARIAAYPPRPVTQSRVRDGPCRGFLLHLRQYLVLSGADASPSTSAAFTAAAIGKHGLTAGDRFRADVALCRTARATARHCLAGPGMRRADRRSGATRHRRRRWA